MSRPGPLIAASVLMIIFGILTVLGSGCLGAFVFAPELIPGPLVEENILGLDKRVVKEIPSYPIVESTAYIASLIVGLAIVVAGFGVYSLSERARKWGILLSALELVLEMLHNGYNAAVIVPLQNRLDAEDLLIPGPEMEAITWGGLAVGMVITLVIWITIICLLCNARVRAACNGEFEESGRRRFDRFDDDDDDFDDRYPPRPRPSTDITDRPGG